MILNFVDRVVQSFSIGRLIIVSLVARILALFLLPPTPSFLAPDEGNYAYLALWVAESKDVETYPAFGAGLYNTSKTLILPAAFLVKIGLDELTAVRMVSVAFGLISIYFFSRIIFLVLRITSLQDVRGALSQRLVLVALILFAFLPSHFIWSTLGLRESASKAMLLASVFFLLRLREVELSRSNIPQAVLAISFPILTIMLSFGARRQTAFVFVVFFCLAIVVMSRRRNFLSLTGVILLGSVLGLVFSTTPTTTASVQFAWVPAEQVDEANNVTKSPAPVASETKSPAPVASETKSPAPVASETKSPAPVASETKSPAPVASETKSPAPVASETKSPAPVTSETKSPAPVTSETKSPAPVAIRTDGTVAVCEKEGDRIATVSGELVCSSKTVTKKQISVSEVANQAPVKTLDELEYQRDVNRLDAQSALTATNCTNYSQLSIQNLTCNAKEFPYRATAFLIRPLPILDSGSLSNNLASAENMIWILLLVSFLYFLRVSFQNRFKLEVVIPTTLFIVFFSSLAALYEGNLGTAFRHKSTILWSLLLVIAIGINSNWRKSEEERQEENPRYAS